MLSSAAVMLLNFDPVAPDVCWPLPLLQLHSSTTVDDAKLTLLADLRDFLQINTAPSKEGVSLLAESETKHPNTNLLYCVVLLNTWHYGGIRFVVPTSPKPRPKVS